MESCQISQSLETSENLTGPNGEAQLTFSAVDSRAKTSPLRVKEQELPESVRDFGRSMRDSLEKFGLNLSLPKTHHCFALGELELSSKIWPRWGIMQDGACWELGTLVRPINETECGYLLPTPDASKRGPTKNYDPKAKSQSGRTLQSLAACDPLGKTWPTPTRRDWKGTNAPAGLTRKDGKSRLDQLPNAVAYGGTQTPQKWMTPQSRDWKGPSGRAYKGEAKDLPAQTQQAGGQLNPSWVEWLMGWPIGWTDLKPLETDKFRNVQQWHSEFFRKD
jgi:hypothetical protein